MKNIILLFVIFSFSFSLTNASPDSPRVGVWITAFSEEKVLHSKENVDRLIETCLRCGIRDIYIQLYRADEAYYDSDLTDRTNFDRILKEAGTDTIKYLISESRKNGLDVHAWMNLLSVARNKNANIIKKFGPGVLTVDQHGRTSMPEGKKDELDRFYIRENQLFLEPADSRVRKYLADIAEEVARKYPGISGLHFDYVRYPQVVPFIPGSRFVSRGINYGYGKKSLEGFKKRTGLDAKKMPPERENYKLWDDWHRDAVTSLASEISSRVRAVSSAIKLSCTIMPSVERTYLVTFQDWTKWLKAGHLDWCVAMNYTDDPAQMRLAGASLLMPGVKERIYLGIGLYLFRERIDIFKEELAIARKLSPGGIVIFSYDDIAKSKAAQTILGTEPGKP